MDENAAVALDALGRPLKVGDHVAWGVKGAIRLGFVSSIEPVMPEVRGPSKGWVDGVWDKGEPLGIRFSHWHVTASDGNGHSMGRSSKAFVGIVIGDIQDVASQLGTDAYKQLGHEPSIVGDDEMVIKKDYYQFLLDHVEGHMRMDTDGATR